MGSGLCQQRRTTERRARSTYGGRGDAGTEWSTGTPGAVSGRGAGRRGTAVRWTDRADDRRGVSGTSYSTNSPAGTGGIACVWKCAPGTSSASSSTSVRSQSRLPGARRTELTQVVSPPGARDSSLRPRDSPGRSSGPLGGAGVTLTGSGRRDCGCREGGGVVRASRRSGWRPRVAVRRVGLVIGRGGHPVAEARMPVVRWRLGGTRRVSSGRGGVPARGVAWVPARASWPPSPPPSSPACARGPWSATRGR
jgi:hypothetical protein